MFNIDLSAVKVQNNFKPIPSGNYNVILDETEMKDTKSGTGQYINCKFKVLGGEYEGKFLFHMFNIKNDNPKAVEIGLQQLKAFMECAGMTDYKLTSVTQLVGYKASAVVKIKTDEYGEKAVISYFKPLSNEVAAVAPVAKSLF